MVRWILQNSMFVFVGMELHSLTSVLPQHCCLPACLPACYVASWPACAQVMVASIRCAEIMKDQLHNFSNDQAWGSLEQESSEKLVRGFGAHAGQLLDSCLRG